MRFGEYFIILFKKIETVIIFFLGAEFRFDRDKRSGYISRLNFFSGLDGPKIAARRPPLAERKQARLVLIPLGAFVFILVAYGVFIRPWMLNWGATAAETRLALPGDELVSGPGFQSTRAMTIAAPAEEVWAWLIQLGQNRGGFYSYSWLENLFFVDIRNTNDVLPEWQNVEPGDLVAMTPRNWPLGLIRRAERSIGVRIERADRPDLLVLRGWGSFVLRKEGEKATRLIIRGRSARISLLSRILMSLFFDPIHFVMERQMMKGIRLRAEGGVEAASFGESVATAGFLQAALTSSLLILSQRRKRLWVVLPLAYALAIIFSTSDLKAALVGFSAVNLMIGGGLFLRRLRWVYFLGMFFYIQAVLFIARDAYVVFGVVFLLVLPFLFYPLYYRKIVGFLEDLPSDRKTAVRKP